MSRLLTTFPFQETLGGVDYCEGPYIFTSSYGRLLDLTAGGTAYSLLGWKNQEVNDAIACQLSKFSHLDYKTFDDPNRHALADLLTSEEQDLDYCFLSGGSGAEACEMAVHMSYQQHYEEGNPDKRMFISRRQSYHGATSMAMALSDRPNLGFFEAIHPQNIVKVEEPYYLRNRTSVDESEEDYCRRLLDEFRGVIDRTGAHNIAGFVAETCLGGLVGDVPPPQQYWSGIREICTEHNIHLILDEVWCGTGSSGKFNCYEYDSIKPDFMFLGKTLGCGYAPISAVLTNKDFFHAIESGSKKICTSTTFQGHSTSVAAALAVQSIIKKKEFLDRVTNQGEMLRLELKSQLKDCGNVINVRGRGLRNSIEYNIENPNLFGQQVSEIMLRDHGILVSGKWHRIGLCHALNIDDDILMEAIHKLARTIVELADRWCDVKKEEIVQRHVY